MYNLLFPTKVLLPSSTTINQLQYTKYFLLTQENHSNSMERLPVALAIMLAVIASGCATQTEAPDPEVVSSEQRQGVLEIVQGQATIQADIKNNGGSGDVTATATILDENQTVLDRATQTFYMDQNETRRIEIQTQVPQGANSYNLTVEPAR